MPPRAAICDVMALLHMSKVAVSCASVETLKRRMEARVRDGIVPVVTRFRPKRAEELIGGSMFWIVKQRLAARQTILGFDIRASDRKTLAAEMGLPRSAVDVLAPAPWPTITPAAPVRIRCIAVR